MWEKVEGNFVNVLECISSPRMAKQFTREQLRLIS